MGLLGKVSKQVKKAAAKAKAEARKRAEQAARASKEAKAAAEKAAAEANAAAEREAKKRAEQVAREAKKRAEQAAREAKKRAEQAAREAKKRAEQVAREAEKRAEQAAREAKKRAEQAAAEAKRLAEEGARSAAAAAAAAAKESRAALDVAAKLAKDGAGSAGELGQRAGELARSGFELALHELGDLSAQALNELVKRLSIQAVRKHAALIEAMAMAIVKGKIPAGFREGADVVREHLLVPLDLRNSVGAQRDRISGPSKPQVSYSMANGSTQTTSVDYDASDDDALLVTAENDGFQSLSLALTGDVSFVVGAQIVAGVAWQFRGKAKGSSVGDRFAAIIAPSGGAGIQGGASAAVQFGAWIGGLDHLEGGSLSVQVEGGFKIGAGVAVYWTFGSGGLSFAGFTVNVGIGVEAELNVSGGWTFLIPEQGILSELSGDPIRLELADQYQSYGGSFGDPRLIPRPGQVVLEGRVKSASGAWKGVIARVPPRFFPPKDLVFNMSDQAATVRVDVKRTGEIKFIATQEAVVPEWLSLCGINWSTSPGKELPLDSGMRNYGSVYGAASFVRHSKLFGGGVVQVSGLVRSRSGAWENDATLATLPEDHRPPKRLVFNMSNHESSVRVDVDTNGRILFVATDGAIEHNWVSLSGINFATHDGDSLPLGSNIVSFGKPYGSPTVFEQGGLVLVSGLIKSTNGDWSGPLATLPPEYRPKERLTFSLNNHESMVLVDVDDATGEIVLLTPASELDPNWLSLAGIVFQRGPS